MTVLNVCRSLIAAGTFLTVFSFAGISQAITYPLDEITISRFSEYSPKRDGVRLYVNPGVYENGTYIMNRPRTPATGNLSLGVGMSSDFHDADDLGRSDVTQQAEILFLRFDTNVALTSLSFSNLDSSEQFILAYDTNGDGVLDTNTMGLSASASGDYDFSGEAYANGTIFGILAATALDAFYLSSVSVSEAPPISAVPLPGALPLYALGVGLLGLAGLRRKHPFWHSKKQ